MSVGQASIPPFGDAEDPSRPLGLLSAELGAPPGPGLALGEVQDSGPVTGVHRLE